MIDATLRLFKAVLIDARRTTAIDSGNLEATIPFGFILDPSIELDAEARQIIANQIGVSGEQANATFHKSWEKVRSANLEQLVLEQVIHYLTTYGFQEEGLYDSDLVYIPNEKLEIPEITDDLSLTYIRGLTADQLRERVALLGSGIALSEQSLDDIMAIIAELECEPSLVERVGNHELRARLCDFFGIVPSEPVDFLRYVIFRLTGSSLLIKNDALIESIKETGGDHASTLDDFNCLGSRKSRINFLSIQTAVPRPKVDFIEQNVF